MAGKTSGEGVGLGVEEAEAERRGCIVIGRPAMGREGEGDARATAAYVNGDGEEDR